MKTGLVSIWCSSTRTKLSVFFFRLCSGLRLGGVSLQLCVLPRRLAPLRSAAPASSQPGPSDEDADELDDMDSRNAAGAGAGAGAGQATQWLLASVPAHSTLAISVRRRAPATRVASLRLRAAVQAVEFHTGP